MFGSFGRRFEGVWVFRLSQMVRFAPFFFFFEFRPKSGRFGRYRPILADTGRYRPILADICRYGRYGPSRPDFGRVDADFSRVGPRRPDSGLATWHDAARTRGLRRPSRVAASRRVGRGCARLGAASVHPSVPLRLKLLMERPFIRSFKQLVWY